MLHPGDAGPKTTEAGTGPRPDSWTPTEAAKCAGTLQAEVKEAFAPKPGTILAALPRIPIRHAYRIPADAAVRGRDPPEYLAIMVFLLSLRSKGA